MLIREKLNIVTSFKDYIEVVESVIMSWTLLTHPEILENIYRTSDDEENDVKENSIIIERVIRSKEAEKTIETFRILIRIGSLLSQNSKKLSNLKKFCIKNS